MTDEGSRWINAANTRPTPAIANGGRGGAAAASTSSAHAITKIATSTSVAAGCPVSANLLTVRVTGS